MPLHKNRYGIGSPIPCGTKLNSRWLYFDKSGIRPGVTEAVMKRKVETRRTGEKSRKCTTSTLQGLSLRKSFFFDKKHESHQGKEPPYSLLELYFSQKGYFLLSTLRFMIASVTPGLIHRWFSSVEP